jgi:hypothetical protein
MNRILKRFVYRDHRVGVQKRIPTRQHTVSKAESVCPEEYVARPTEFRLKFPKFNKFLNEGLPRTRLGKRSFDSVRLPIHSKQRMQLLLRK